MQYLQQIYYAKPIVNKCRERCHMNPQIKMIVTDLDGTLLRSDKTISGYTKAVLSQCRKQGIKIVYATGRGGSADSVAPASMFDGRITMNGAIVLAEGFEAYSLIPSRIARPVLIACDRRGLKTSSEAVDGMHHSNFSVCEEWPGLPAIDNIVDFTKHNVDAAKLYAIIQTPEDIMYIESHLPEELYQSVSRDGLSQIMHKDATKSKAIAKLARLWDIAPSEIAAFGDDLNDIDMLTYAGIGVAMGNAVDDVKAVCNHTCPSNDSDGLARWIAHTNRPPLSRLHQGFDNL